MKARNVSVSTTQISGNELLLNIVIHLPGSLKYEGGKVSEKSRKDSQKYLKKIIEQIEFPNIGSVEGS